MIPCLICWIGTVFVIIGEAGANIVRSHLKGALQGRFGEKSCTTLLYARMSGLEAITDEPRVVNTIKVMRNYQESISSSA